MEGNDCYKYSTISRFLTETGEKPIASVVDIGANIGDTLLLAYGYFPEANIIGYEPVKEYWAQATHRTAHLRHVIVRNAACAGHHRFRDDLGREPRATTADLRIFLALPDSGPGWLGGSKVDVAEDDKTLFDSAWRQCYKLCPENVIVRSLQEVIEFEKLSEIDILKIDCEGCEFSLLGSSTPDVLHRIRFICGEYHDIQRFYAVMKARLFETHKVCLVGGRFQGSFFAERLDEDRDGILRFSRAGMLALREHLGPEPLEWNPFAERFVASSERVVHGLPPVKPNASGIMLNATN